MSVVTEKQPESWFMLNRRFRDSDSVEFKATRQSREEENWTVIQPDYTFYIARRAHFNEGALQPDRIEDHHYLPKWDGLTPETPAPVLRQAVVNRIGDLVPLPKDFLTQNTKLEFLDKGAGHYEIHIPLTVNKESGARQEILTSTPTA